MSEPTELDQRIERLRADVRRATLAGDRNRARELRRELREAEELWHQSFDELDAGKASGRAENGGRAAGELLLPLREQVHQALTLLTVPAAPRLISTVHEALFTGAIGSSRLTSLRRDEERSFRTAPYARPYYLCVALTADLLAPARGLLAVSTWPMDRRIIGPLSPRVDFLTAAVAIAENVQRIPNPDAAALRLLWKFAANIPGAASQAWRPDPDEVARAARAELEVHADADARTRKSAATRARRQLDEVQQLFGSKFRTQSRASVEPA